MLRWSRGVFLLVFFALFLFRLDAQSLWYDEAVSARLAAMSAPDLVRWTANDIQPPLYYLLLHLWTSLAGNSEWALRFVSAWWGLLAVALAYVLAHRLTHSEIASLGAMCLLGFAPWLLYYSQEARMYTMLVTLGMLWVVPLLQSRLRTRDGFLVGVLALVLMYTHYFSLFLIAGLAFWHLLTPGSRRERMRFWGIVLAVLFLGYLPWAPFLWHRFRVDASYWTGTLKLGEALRHWAIHMSLGAPETFLEPAAVRELPFFALWTLLAILSWIVPTCGESPRRKEAGRALALLLVWLLLPSGFILALAYRTPKFNPRYLMLVYPAWGLLLATGPARWHCRPEAKIRADHRLREGMILLFYLLPLFLFARADMAWFRDPAFTKPDFREAIAYIQKHRRPGEILFLVSGHMSPLVDYYAPGTSYVRLPDEDVLDVNRVLDFSIAPRINRAIAGAPGVWLLLWQNKVVDPMGIVPYLLQHAGREDPAVPNAFWHVRVRHFHLPPAAHVPEIPPISHAVRANWGGEVEFLGIELQNSDNMTLFFRPLRPIRDDLRLHVEVWDSERHLWGQSDTRPGPYLYPTFRWHPGQIVMGIHPIPVVKGTPAGTYTLRFRLYSQKHLSGLPLLDILGNPEGTDVIVPHITVLETRSIHGSEETFPPLPPNITKEKTFARNLSSATTTELTPVAVRLWPRPPWEPGMRVHVQLRWRSIRPPRTNDHYRLTLTRGAKQVLLAQGDLAAVDTPQDGWPTRGGFFSQIAARLPKDAEAGTWELILRLGNRENVLSSVDIKPSQRHFTLPPVASPVNADFGRVIRLVGVDLPSHWKSGASLPVTVTWQALTEMERSYTAFVHLLGPGGRVLSQEDHVPERGRHPTDEWLAGEVIRDRFDLPLPAHLPAQGMILEIGLYDASASGMPRLRVTQGPAKGQTVVRLPLK
jgi:Predicted membrane protein